MSIDEFRDMIAHDFKEGLLCHWAPRGMKIFGWSADEADKFVVGTLLLVIGQVYAKKGIYGLDG